MRSTRTLSLTLLAVAAFAGEAEPWLTVSVPDGVRSAERFNASVYGKVFNSPEFAPLKAKWVAAMGKGTENQPAGQGNVGDDIAQALLASGIKPLDLFTSLRFFDLVLHDKVTGKDSGKVQPGFRLTFDLGEAFAQVAGTAMTKAVDKGTAQALTVPGADQAILDISGKHDAMVRGLRFGSQFVFTNSERADWQQQVKPVASTHDFTMRLVPTQMAAFIDQAVPEAERAQLGEGMLDLVLDRLRSMAGAIEATMDLVPAGMGTHVVIPGTTSFNRPVELKALAKLPATTLSAVAVGLDGAAWWAREKPELFKQIGAKQTPPISGEQVEENLDAALKSQGLGCTAAALFSSITGTGMFALMQAAPFPTAVLAIPRSPALDEVVALALKRAEQELPAEGAMAMIPLGMMPISLTLVRAPGHWVVTTDTMLASTWTDPAPGGFLDTAVGKLAVEKAGKDAWLVGAADNAAEIRMYTGFLAMGIQQIPDLTPEERQAVMKSMQVLAQHAKPGWCTARNTSTTTVMDVTGLNGGLMPIAIIAAIAIPNLLESRVTANESAAATTLKSGVLPAQMQFQAGNYMDQDKDGSGEYGFFQELAGGPIAGQPADKTVKLMMPGEVFNTPEPERNGYRYTIYLPDGQGGAVTERLGVRQPNAAAADAQERQFVVYAWPTDRSQGRKVFALTNDGNVRRAPGNADGEAPQWNALFGGDDKGWADAPAWPVYHR